MAGEAKGCPTYDSERTGDSSTFLVWNQDDDARAAFHVTLDVEAKSETTERGTAFFWECRKARFTETDGDPVPEVGSHSGVSEQDREQIVEMLLQRYYDNDAAEAMLDYLGGKQS